MAENIKQTYHDAEPEMKREYLDLLFKEFIVKDGKIVAAMPSEYIKPLITSGKLTIRIKNGWLPLLDSFLNQEIQVNDIVQLQNNLPIDNDIMHACF